MWCGSGDGGDGGGGDGGDDGDGSGDGGDDGSGDGKLIRCTLRKWKDHQKWHKLIKYIDVSGKTIKTFLFNLFSTRTVFIRQNLTYKDGHRAEKIKICTMTVDP